MSPGAELSSSAGSEALRELAAFPLLEARTSSRPEDTLRFLDAYYHDTTDRLPQIAVPTLVLAGGLDLTVRPALCRKVADLIRALSSR